MATTDLYAVLGVPPGALPDEIRRSYRRLALEYHPDANRDDPRAEERFKELQQAYTVLSDPNKRQNYDALYDANADDADPSTGFSDLFDDPFAPERGDTPRPLRGEDVTVRVGLEFREALGEVTARVAVPVDERCAVCGGERVAKTRCSACARTGRLRATRQVTVKIPAGANDGTKVRVPGRGNAGSDGGPAGDLYVVTTVAKHDVFVRRGDDFHVEVPVSFVEAATGAEVEVPKPVGGMVKLKLPASTQDGRRLRVRGAGAPKARGGGSGDLVARVRVVVPKKLTRRQREILEALEEELNENVRADFLRRSREP